MYLPSETDLPDPPLNNSGELQLPPELISVADRLRREAVVVAESSVPQTAAAPLLRHAAAGGHRQTWRQVALTIAVLTICASCAAIALILRHEAELRRPLPNRSLPRIARPDRASYLASIAASESSPNVYLSADGGPRDPNLEMDFAAAADSYTPEQRIEMLERTVESYRNALQAHHERLMQLKTELDQANAKLQQQ